MSLTEETVQDQIEVKGEHKLVHVRTATVIKRDGVEISRSYHRHIIEPNISADDLANESTEVQAICNAVHTDAIKTAYATHLENSEE
jgi:hypothetical protein